MTYRVVWFKRDLRVQDHWPLFEAARQGRVLCLYVVEPKLWAQPDAAAQHYGFVRESLQVLSDQLQALGARLHVAVGEVVDVLSALHAVAPFEEVLAHEETGNAFTFARDLAVGRWCRMHNVGWHECPQFGGGPRRCSATFCSTAAPATGAVSRRHCPRPMPVRASHPTWPTVS